MAERANGPRIRSHTVHVPAATPFLAVNEHEDLPAQMHHKTVIDPGRPARSILPHIVAEATIEGRVRDEKANSLGQA